MDFSDSANPKGDVRLFTQKSYFLVSVESIV